MKGKFERLYPLIGGGIAAGTFFAFTVDVARLAKFISLAPTEFFGSIFDLVTVLTGLLFSVYVLAIAPGGGFIERIFPTKMFSVYRRYVVEALVLGFVCAMVSLPIKSLSSLPSSSDIYWRSFLTFWIFISVAAILAFFRAAHIFFVIAASANPARRQS